MNTIRRLAFAAATALAFTLSSAAALASGTYCEGYKAGWEKAVASQAVKPPYRGCPGNKSGPGTEYDRGFDAGYAAGKAAR